MSPLNRACLLAELLVGAAPVGLFLGSWLRDHLREEQGARVEWLTPREQRIVADSQTKQVIATYRLLNAGVGNLVLGEVTTTCGCSVGSIDRRIVEPRQTATIVVEGDPPDAGSRDVWIDVKTNEKAGKQTLKLTMVGSTPLPYVGHYSGTIQFGAVEGDSATTSFFIDTHERGDSSPWAIKAQPSCAYMVVREGGVEEVERTEAYVVPRRHFTALHTRLQSLMKIDCTVDLLDGSSLQAPVLHIPVRGTVRPDVYAIPTALHANVDSSTATISLDISIQWKPGLDLEITPQENPLVACELRATTPSRLDFRLTIHAENPRDASEIKFLFLTNHPALPVVEVPITIVGS